MSEWLKHTLRTARERDPIDVLNELEVLNALLRLRCQALLEVLASDVSAR